MDQQPRAPDPHDSATPSPDVPTWSLARRFENVLGRSIEPSFSLDREPPADPAAVAGLLAQLGQHSPLQSRYRVKGIVAEGGMGTILKVWDEDLRRNLAMKIIHGKHGEETVDAVDKKALRRFLDEAQVTAQLEHPGVVPIHELGIDESGRAYFTMSLVEGEVLTRIFSRVRHAQEGWSLQRALGVMLRVAEAMAYVHSRGVIHRDLKPDNVMVGRFGQAYVMDWGLARVLGREGADSVRNASDRVNGGVDSTAGARTTLDGEVIGTPAYMAPEQGEGRGDLGGPQSDVYSLGAMLYELLTGRVPYEIEAVARTPLSILERVLQGPPIPVREFVPGAPPELVAICEKAMEHDLANRYATMDDLATDLRAWLEGRVVRAFESGAVAEVRKWVNRNRVLAALLVVIVFLTSFFLVRLDRENRVARASESRAKSNEADARLARDRLLRLADGRRLAELRARMDALWPALPENAGAMRAWLDEASALVARLPDHRAQLARLDGGEFDPLGLSAAEAAWWRDALAGLVEDLEDFTRDEPAAESIASVRARLDFASSIREVSIDRERAAWDAAIAACADRSAGSRYGGLELSPQVGLVPLGADSASGLQEFWHVASGERPKRGADGRIAPRPEDGIVLVLIPGGEHRLGAQSEDPAGPGFVPSSEPEEGPVRSEALDPYFVAKHETTQAQWLRLTGENPSSYSTATRPAEQEVTLLHPVETVSHERCLAVLRRYALDLPTEARWEAAARATTSTPWWAGGDVAALQGTGNLADVFCRDHGGPAGWTYESALDDGFLVHAPIGSFRPNGYGLHDVIGNVWEWCSDPLADYRATPHEGDGERDAPQSRNRVLRGGAFSATADHARSAYRAFATTDYRFNSVGVRAARPLDP